jgi:hypothetical protein
VAATTQLALPTRVANPIALWHLLSLDAPTVAVLWTWFIARACQIRLPIATPIAMALAVWILYAADRILDARPLDTQIIGRAHQLEARHLFHHRHARAFLAGIALAAIALAALLPSLDPAAIRLYLIEGALLAAWFLILHTTRNAHRLPKEFAVGLFFSVAAFIPTFARAPSLHLTLLPSAILFAALCSLNCLFICAWEHQRPHPANAQPHATTSLALRHLPALSIALAVAAAALVFFPTTPKPIPAACAIAALLLLVLHRNRRRLAPTNLRAAADLALFTPLLLLPFLR